MIFHRKAKPVRVTQISTLHQTGDPRPDSRTWFRSDMTPPRSRSLPRDLNLAVAVGKRPAENHRLTESRQTVRNQIVLRKSGAPDSIHPTWLTKSATT